MGPRIERYRHVESILPIIELLEQSTNIGAKEEALKILAFVSTDEECRSAIRQAGGICSLVEVLNSPSLNETLIENTLKVVRQLANDSPATRKALRQTGAVEPLMRLTSLGEDSPAVVEAIAAIGYLVHNDPSTKASVRKMGGIPLLVRMLHADPAKPVTCYAAAALHNLVEGSSRNKQALRAAGAVPRLVQLLDTDPSNPLVEVVVRTLQKMAEKSEDNQADIRRARGIAKLVEMQSKGAGKSLSQWIEKTLQTLKLTEREMDDAKVFLCLGKSFQKEFDKAKGSSDQVLAEVVSLRESMTKVVTELMEQLNQHRIECSDMRAALQGKDGEISSLQGQIQEMQRKLEEAEASLDDKEKHLQDFQEDLFAKEEQIQSMKDEGDERERQAIQLEVLVEERDKQLQQAQDFAKEQSRHLEQAEGLLLEKEKMVQEAQALGREEWRQYQSERDNTIIQTVQSLRDLIVPSSSFGDKKQSQDISESINSLLHTTPKSHLPQPKLPHHNTSLQKTLTVPPWMGTKPPITQTGLHSSASLAGGFKENTQGDMGLVEDQAGEWTQEENFNFDLGNLDDCSPSPSPPSPVKHRASTSAVPGRTISIGRQGRKMSRADSTRKHSRGSIHGGGGDKLGTRSSAAKMGPGRTASMPVLARTSSPGQRKSVLLRTTTGGGLFNRQGS